MNFFFFQRRKIQVSNLHKCYKVVVLIFSKKKKEKKREEKKEKKKEKNLKKNETK